ncbi:hypothetical protein ACMATS_06065 [Streptoverticillium reticulum]|uniref:hypothetical protein n=1 Tax=Streptoverticillium reticulum TaxID=1433415 RepID=UPI0039BFCF7A
MLHHPYSLRELDDVPLVTDRTSERIAWNTALMLKTPLAMVDIRQADGYRAVLDTVPAGVKLDMRMRDVAWLVLRRWLADARAHTVYVTDDRISALIPSLAAATILTLALSDAQAGDAGPLTGLINVGAA